MNKRFVGSIVLALSLAAAGPSGCTTMRLVPHEQGLPLPPAIEVGDRISVLDSAGLSTDFEVTVIGSDFVEGKTKSDQPVRVALADMHEVRERRVAWGKTVLLAVGLNILLAEALATVYVVPVGL